MKLYRFSPIQNESQLHKAIKHIHVSSYKLCKQSMGVYLPNAGNIGVFCHHEPEYEYLTKVREKLTESTGNLNQKYFHLYTPLEFPEIGDIPETTYTYLYIRKPDPYRHHVGDIDFYLEPKKYTTLKHSLQNGNSIKGARIFSRPDLDMIELYDPDVDVCAYISTKKMTETVRVKQ